MTPYQMGYLAGAAVGAVLGIVLVRSFVRSDNKVHRIAGVVGGVLCLTYAFLAVGQLWPKQKHKRFAAGYQNGCEKRCVSEGGDETQCKPYCLCQVERMLALPDVDQVIGSFEGVRSEADIPADTRARITSIANACTPAPLYDASFMAQCQATCDDPSCPTYCKCYLDTLRKGLDPQTGTAWLLTNVDAAPATPEGEARTAAAMKACSPDEVE